MLGTEFQIGRTEPALIRDGLGARLRDYVALTKPRPMSIVLAAAAAGYLAAPALSSSRDGVLALLAIGAGGGGAAALNMWYERDLDAGMTRTAGRPVAAGRIPPSHALVFALALIFGSVALMALAATATAAAMLALTISFYGVVYTMWLKRVTALNVLFGGGVASVLTPLTGWAAATGSVSFEALSLFAFLFAWTPPHVWSQALVRHADYARVGVPMMPVVAGSEATKKLIVLFTATHVLLSLWPVAIGAAGWLFGAVAVVAGGLLLIEAARLAGSADEALALSRAWTFYRRSIGYVIAMLVALAVDGRLSAMDWLGPVGP